MPLTLAEAKSIIDGAIARANELKIRISVAVCDSGGRLIAVNTMDGAFMAAAFGSQGKAIASAAFARRSADLAHMADGPLVRGIAAAEGGHMIPSGGALPVFRNGQVEGACGVGGGADEEDEECARAGIAGLEPVRGLESPAAITYSER